MSGKTEQLEKPSWKAQFFVRLFVCLFVLTKTADFPEVGGGQSRTPGVFHPAELGGGDATNARAGEWDDTAAMIFRDESIVALVARPIITSASEFPGGKSKTSRVEMSRECAVQWKMGWRLPGRLSSLLKSPFMLMNKQSTSKLFRSGSSLNWP